jgi:hypothetical protein
MHNMTHAAQCAGICCVPVLAGHINHDIFWTNLAPEKVRHRLACTVSRGKSMFAQRGAGGRVSLDSNLTGECDTVITQLATQCAVVQQCSSAECGHIGLLPGCNTRSRFCRRHIIGPSCRKQHAPLPRFLDKREGKILSSHHGQTPQQFSANTQYACSGLDRTYVCCIAAVCRQDAAPCSGELHDAIKAKWGSLDNFTTTFNTTTAAVQVCIELL